MRPARETERVAWDTFVAALPSADPLQSWAWGEVARTGRERPRRIVATDEDGTMRGVAQVLVRDAAAGRRVLYVPHGPAWDASAPDADAVLDALAHGLRMVGREERGIVAKLDPRATPAVSAGRLHAALRSRDLRPARADLQARTTRLIDLRPGAEAVFAGLEKDTRNLVRRSAREGVRTRVVRDADSAAYGTFSALLARTGTRAGFRVRPAAALEAIARQFAVAGDAYLVLADLEGEAIAGCLALATGPRAFYLYAASLRDGPRLKHANGPYAALWACIQALAADGRESLDLWGVVEPGDTTADPGWSGFSLFKRGFGGIPLAHPGTFDLVLSPAWYALRDIRERLRR
ncbi:MAG: peptidoglycan bridge formation glycyltransferase FemA/FemB family protein [Chloroflexi bacterium]|nr:peptidoglycan bridge formation glycyltransferase FemA/FemB family protein [Chloroflexota bacterium]